MTMEYDYFDKYTFLCEMYDEDADAMKELVLHFFPFDNSVQVIEPAKGKNLVRRVQLPPLKLAMLQIGNIVNIFSKLLHIKDCAPVTRRTLLRDIERELIMSRPTYQQLEVLVDFLAENPGIAKGLLRSANGKYETKRKWEEVSITINAQGGAQKDGKGWAKYWADKKCALKKICAQHAQSLRRTGGGPARDIPGLTPIDLRLVQVMGGPQFAAGDSHVAVNPFPSTSQPIGLESSHNVVLESPASPMQAAETVRVHTPSPTLPRERSPLRPVRIRSPQTNERHRSRAGRTVLDQERDRFAAIEAQRVEAETITARALSHAVEQMGNLTAAVESLSTATREGAQTIADALSQIAAALQRN